MILLLMPAAKKWKAAKKGKGVVLGLAPHNSGNTKDAKSTNRQRDRLAVPNLPPSPFSLLWGRRIRPSGRRLVAANGAVAGVTWRVGRSDGLNRSTDQGRLPSRGCRFETNRRPDRRGSRRIAGRSRAARRRSRRRFVLV